MKAKLSRSSPGASSDEEEEGWEGINIAETTLLMVDTTGCEMSEAADEGQSVGGGGASLPKKTDGTGFASSKYNLGEAELVVAHVRRLLKIGVSFLQGSARRRLTCGCVNKHCEVHVIGKRCSVPILRCGRFRLVRLQSSHRTTHKLPW